MHLRPGIAAFIKILVCDLVGCHALITVYLIDKNSIPLTCTVLIASFFLLFKSRRHSGSSGLVCFPVKQILYRTFQGVRLGKRCLPVVVRKCADRKIGRASCREGVRRKSMEA